MTAGSLDAHIRSRLAQARVDVSASIVAQLVSYVEILARWNQRINLTAFDLSAPSDAAIDRLIVEPVAAAREVGATDRFAIDVGSGGGSPAIPLKIATPALRMQLFESRTRKSAFLREAVRALELDGVGVDTARFEAATLPQALTGAADLISLRAVRADAAMWTAIDKALGLTGRVLWFADPGRETMHSSASRGRWLEAALALPGWKAPYLAVLRRTDGLDKLV